MTKKATCLFITPHDTEKIEEKKKTESRLINAKTNGNEYAEG